MKNQVEIDLKTAKSRVSELEKELEDLNVIKDDLGENQKSQFSRMSISSLVEASVRSYVGQLNFHEDQVCE